MTANATIQGRQKRKLSSLTPRSKVKLLPLVIPWPPRIRQIHLWQPHLPNNILPNYPHSLLPRNNPILYR